jgi:hypothetical protein
MTWRRPITRGALLLMESFWVYAVGAFFVALVAKGDKPSLPATMLVVALSFSISRYLQASALSLGLLRFYGVFLSLLLFYGIARVDFFGDFRFYDFSWADGIFLRTEATMRDHAEAVIGIPVLWLFWIRGVLRGQEYLGFEAVLGSFAMGLVTIACVSVFAGALDMPGFVDYLPVAYISVGLLAIGLAHAARAEDEFGRSFTGTWLVAVGGSVGALALLALLFVVLDYGAAFGTLSDGANAVLWVVGRVAYYASWPFIWVIEQVFEFIRWLTQGLYGGVRQPPQELQEEEQRPEEQEEGRGLPRWAELIVRAVITGSFIVLILAGIALAFTRFRKRRFPGDVKESIYTEGRLAADLGDLLGSLIGRFRPNFRPGRADLDAARRLYFDMLAAGEQRGVERRPAETPQELAPRLSSALQTNVPQPVTRLFDDVRYGALPPSEEEVRRLRAEWEAHGSPSG